jgi:YidC/Oxa1 family membrane protein insertase
MDRIRFALWFGLLAAIWMSYTTWITENRPDPVPASTDVAPALPADDVPQAADPGELPELAADSDPDSTADGVPGPGAGPGQPAAAAPDGQLIRVRTDVLDLRINPAGGDIVRADLLRYPVDKSNPDQLIRLLDNSQDSLWVFQTGIVSGGDRPSPNHQQRFTSASGSYELAADADSLEVRLEWTGGDGISAAKVYTFRRGDYAIDLELQVDNAGGEAWPATPYAQMTRRHAPQGRSYLDVDSYSFTGPAFHDGEKYEHVDFGDLQKEPIEREVANGWVASIQHHFLAAIVPPPDLVVEYDARTTGERYRLRILGDGSAVAPGADFSYPFRLFVGPKLQDQLNAAAPGRELKRTVDYGMLYFLSQPLFFVLDFIHGWVGNWGLSIIITTILIKLAFYKLTATSGRSMAKMRKVAPRMKALQEKHKDDRPALSAAMMELYKKEKINPAAGCLPILIQMPFFFAFYWVLIESVEMRQAPFFLWIDDLSVRDPFFILPILMFGAMWFQMRLNPTPPDPVQAKVMQIMPIVFAAMFSLFPAGLVLYWLTNTVASIAQQWRINKLVAKEA